MGPMSADPLNKALDILKYLNKLEDDNGKRLSCYVVKDGFEPWWFIQERLFWQILVPYVNMNGRSRERRISGSEYYSYPR